MKNILFIILLLLTVSSYSQNDISGKYGIMNLKGEVIAPFQYDVINYRRNTMTQLPTGMYAASLDGRWGIIDKNGKELVPFIYSEMEDYTEEGLIIARKAGNEGVIDIRGKIRIPFQYKKIDFLSRRLLSVQDKSGECIIVDTLGNTIYSKPFQRAQRESGNQIWILDKENRWGAIDRDGKLKIPFSLFEKVESFGNYSVVTIEGKRGVIDSVGNMLIPAQYSYWDMRMDIKTGIIITKDDGKYTIYHIATKDTISTNYDYITSLENGLLVAKKEGNYGIINKDGNVIRDFMYNDVSAMFSNGLFVMKDAHKKCGAIDKEGKIVTPFLFDHIGNFYRGYAIAKQDGKYGVIDKEGRIVIPFKYSSLDIKRVTSDNAFFSAIIDGFADGITGLIDVDGKQILPYEYDGIAFVDNNCIGVARDNLYGLVDFSGKSIVPIEYERIWIFNDCMILKYKN